jgi:fido (protein-threonine AMPylation protein)
VEGFDAVDPQHPLGGPDGLKDVVCTKDALRWVAAAYFPTTPPTFPEIRAKFEHDLSGVGANNCQAFVFFVNQPLTIAEREALARVAVGTRVEIYHLERIVGILNAPKGCGLRLEYLRIPMSEEEQWAFWNAMNSDIARQLAESERRRDLQIRSLEEKVDRLLERTMAIQEDLRVRPSSVGTGSVIERLEMPTASLSVTTLCWIHRILTEGMPEATRGRLRSINVWVGPANSTPSTASHIAPPPDQVLTLTEVLLREWREKHDDLRSAARDEILAALARFHHGLLVIHPFLDANGRVARCLLDQAARELLNQGIGPEFAEPPTGYYETLKCADRGDLRLLIQRISVSLI